MEKDIRGAACVMLDRASEDLSILLLQRAGGINKP
jgi:hypothetical protein